MSRNKHYYNNIIDIFDRTNRIKQKTKNTSFEDFIKNSDLQEIIEYNLLIIGETISKVPNEILLKYNSDSLYWRQIKDMRNFLIHQYWGVSLKMVYQVATVDILDLEKFIEKMIIEEKENFE